MSMVGWTNQGGVDGWVCTGERGSSQHFIQTVVQLAEQQLSGLTTEYDLLLATTVRHACTAGLICIAEGHQVVLECGHNKHILQSDDLT